MMNTNKVISGYRIKGIVIATIIIILVTFISLVLYFTLRNKKKKTPPTPPPPPSPPTPDPAKVLFSPSNAKTSWWLPPTRYAPCDTYKGKELDNYCDSPFGLPTEIGDYRTKCKKYCEDNGHNGPK